MSSGFGHFAKSAFGMALRLGSVVYDARENRIHANAAALQVLG